MGQSTEKDGGGEFSVSVSIRACLRKVAEYKKRDVKPRCSQQVEKFLCLSFMFKGGCGGLEETFDGTAQYTTAHSEDRLEAGQIHGTQEAGRFESRRKQFSSSALLKRNRNNEG